MQRGVRVNKKIKIFVSYHKKSPIIKSDVFEPIEVGRALKSLEDSLKDIMIGDNDGENISEKNPRYCELTAQYYVWKNYEKLGNPDYVGFCHYRRLFNFNTNSRVYGPIFGGDVLEQLMMTRENIENVIQEYGMIVPEAVRFEGYTVFTHYKNSHYITDYQTALDIMLEKYPEFKEAASAYNNGHDNYITNCYIMTREEFFAYMEWLFSILFEADFKIPVYKNTYDNRVVGFVAERLLGIYVTQLKKTKEHKIKELQQVLYLPTNKDVIPVIFAANNYYSMPLYVAITSILKNANPNDFYAIYVLCDKDKLSLLNKNLLISRSDYENCHIDFVDTSNIDFDKFPRPDTCKYITKETYYRYIIPNAFKNYDKCIYLDCDITVNSSLKGLFDTNIENYYFAGVEDILEEDNKTRLGLSKYCNAGVLLLNLKKMREDNIEEKLFDFTMKNQEKLVCQDQDVMNAVMQEGILYLPLSWNTQIRDWDKSTKFTEIKDNANIIHYIGPVKPWDIESKSIVKKEFYKYYNMTRWNSAVLSFSRYSFSILVYRIYRLVKNFRKQFIKYNKNTKSIVILGRFSFRLK